MDTSQTDYALVRHPLVLRVLVVAGALFGFTLLALAVSGAADASEGSPPPGLLDGAGQTVHGVLEPVEPVLKPVTGTVHDVTAQVAPAAKPVTGAVHDVTARVAPVVKPVTGAVHDVTSQVAPLVKPVAGTLHAVSSLAEPVVKPVTSGLEPVLAPLTRPVLQAAEPVLSALRPVTEPVLNAVSPVTSPVLRATAPVTAPVVRAIGAEHVAPVPTGKPATPAPRGDTTAPWAVAGHPVTVASVVEQGDTQRRHDAQLGSRHLAGDTDAAGVAGPMSGSGGGGLPADVSGMSGAMSAGSGGQHGGEYAVTAAGTGTPGTDRSWRAPPAGSWSLHWLEFYGNDHPS
ncbi:hypothetical protein VA596_30395 [Amycolatopsis sp., V23-08]|uniref:Uncharacterized protein n=1 Tax=Amycolatopsis heterodermiae TaxID=3110235 RepID=A0ABU5RE71_9PSEU|nr:hypothetical protein [Amycolatopsis sp., V23-08]MEA5363879.1 hypothetical protein [Amycolatopsis sp., V23-08]